MKCLAHTAAGGTDAVRSNQERFSISVGYSMGIGILTCAHYCGRGQLLSDAQWKALSAAFWKMHARAAKRGWGDEWVVKDQEGRGDADSVSADGGSVGESEMGTRVGCEGGGSQSGSACSVGNVGEKRKRNNDVLRSRKNKSSDWASDG